MTDDDTDEDGQRDRNFGREEETGRDSDDDREKQTDRSGDRDGRPARDDEFGLADDEFPEDEPSSDLSSADVRPDPASPGDLPGDGSGDAGGAGDGDGDASAPLSELRADIEERRETETDDEADLSELFTEVDVGSVDEDTVWEELSAAAETPTVEPGSAVPEDDTDREAREVTVVEKRLCHDCPHVSNPPEIACTHDGTTIEAEVDVDHFRVVDCPIVAEREKHDEMETSGFSADDS